MKKPQIELVSVAKLVPYAGNPMVHPDNQIRELAAVIREFGFQQPILCDINGVIIAGHGRLLAAKLAGLERVPVIYASDLTEDQIKAFRIADNKLARKSTWDMEALAKEIGELSLTDFDLALTGMSDDEITGLLEVDILPDVAFNVQTAERAPEISPAAPSAPRAESEQMRREPEQASGELQEVKPRATSNEHSVFECVMLHSNKVLLVKVLDQIRAENNYEKIEQALMHLVRQHS